MTSHTIADIAAALGATALGAAGEVAVHGAAEPRDAGPDDLALAMKPEYADALQRGKARAAIVWDGADWQAMGLEAAIVVPRPRYALSGVTALFDPGPDIAPGIHETAVIAPSATLGDGVAIGPFVVIGDGVEIGSGARIGAHAAIGAGTRIGVGALIHTGVRIMRQVHIGDRFIAQPGAVIGSDGFSFVTPEKSAVEGVRETLNSQVEAQAQSFERIHSLGSVRIGDDVEVGANSAIDRGTIRPTALGRGTKLDNLVHVGHNVVVGEAALLCGQVGIAGHIRLGMGAQIAAASNVKDSVPPGARWAGTPAKAARAVFREMAALKRLGERSAKDSG